MQRRKDRQKKCRPQKTDASRRYPPDIVELPQHHKNNCCELSKRVCLAENARTKIAQPGNGVKHSADGEDANVAAENHNRELPRNLVDNGEHQKHRAEQHFVGNGIEILPEQSLLMQSTRQQSVQSITQASE